MENKPPNLSALTETFTPARAIVFSAALAALLMLVQVRYHWGGESYYNYGWAVPFLAAYLFIRRQNDGPPASPPSRPVQITLFLIGTLAILTLLPFQLLAEVNPFWRLPRIFQAAVLFLLGLIVLFLLGRWRAVFHYLFPLVFLLTMIPWPWQIEQRIIHALTEQVIEATVWVLNLMQYDAQVRGNLIVLAGTTVGVDEACSGIRSLQSLGMVALFLSDFFRIAWGRRMVLFAFAFFCVLLFNTLRSLTLTLIVVHFGRESYDFWHDWVGVIAFIGGVAALYAFTELIKGPEPKEPRPRATASKETERQIPTPEWVGGFRWPIVWAAVALGVWGAKEAWFRYHEWRYERPSWTIEWPDADMITMRVAEIPERVYETLNFDYGERVQFMFPSGEGFDVYYYGYTGERRTVSVSTYGHHPTVCMDVIGAVLVEELEPLHIRKGDVSFPLYHYVFDIPTDHRLGTIRVNVFWTVAERRISGVGVRELEHYHQAFSRDLQLRLMREGRRDFARQVILLSMTGAAHPQAARELVEAFMDEVIVPEET